MKFSEAIYFCLQYQKANSKNNTVKNYEFVLGKFGSAFNGRELESVKTEEVITFLAELSNGRKQNTERGRYMTLSAFFNLLINTVMPDMRNPCQSPAARNLFRKPKAHQWTIGGGPQKLDNGVSSESLKKRRDNEQENTQTVQP